MFQLGYAVTPADDHPYKDTMGDAFVVCWIEKPTLEEAEAVARAALKEQRWVVDELDYGDPVTADDYEEDDELLDFFEQAEIDKEVYMVQTSPKYAVYRVCAKVARTVDGKPETSEAHYMISGDSLLPDDEEDDEVLYAKDFWSPVRAESVLALARAVFDEAGWELAEVKDSGPVCYEDVADELQEFYEHAVEDGSCPVFVS